MQRVPDCNKNETQGGDHKAVLRQKKLKAKTLKLGSSNKGMNSKAEGGGSEGVYDDKVLCSLTTASMNSLIIGKRMRAHGKVAQPCDAIDPPVPRRLRSAINKPVRHVKKRRHLSAISAQISFKDQQTRLDETSPLTEEEEVADALLSLSQRSSTYELMPDKVVADDSTKINVSSTSSCPEGAAKEGDKTVVPSASCIVGRTDTVQHAKSVRGATNHPSDISPPLLEKDKINDLSLGVVAELPSPRRESSHNGAQKQLKVQLDVSENYAAQKPEAPLCVVNSNKSGSLMRANGKDKNNGAQETMHGVLQTPLPCTTPGPDGYSIRPSSSKLAFQANTASEFSEVTAAGNLGKLPQVNNIGVPTKAWKRSMTHVYVSRLIETHLSREKAASQRHVKAEERRPHMRTARPPSGGSTTLHHKSNHAQDDDEARYAVRLDVRLPAQPSTGICDMGRQKMVGGSFLNLPASTAVPGAQHVQYLHPQMTPAQAPMPYPFPHLPQSRAALHHHQQYMCNPGYAARPGMTTASSSAAMMKLQQQQQQMWQLHVAQYQPRAADAAPAGGAWRNLPSLRPVPVLPAPTMPPQMELLCAPYQGGSRQPQQLRLM